MPRVPALFVGHGAAVFTTAPTDPTRRFLASLAPEVDSWKPRGIVVVSAHFAQAPLRVTGAQALETVHDHPAREVYDFRYPARGTAELTNRVATAIRAMRWQVEVDEQRGLDHGAWVPLAALQPDAKVPVVAVSLHASESVEQHLALGRALAPLRDEGLLVIGSGGTTHDQQLFRQRFFTDAAVDEVPEVSRAFDAWVGEQVTSAPGPARAEALARFASHPLGPKAHPTPEHFLPMVVVAAASEPDAGVRRFTGFQHGLSTSVFQFG
ncbi:MAG: class III extradiol ring-cleavage dioxygenase [Myxococcaceae bacterium]|nr:class III extradiol ring-cleavage dioxygenase [Myxococcaceae bacterium]